MDSARLFFGSRSIAPLAAPGLEDDNCCWGVLYSGRPNGSSRRHSRCTGSGRSAGKKSALFKDRFCAACCHPDGFLVLTDRVRAMKITIGEPVLKNSRTMCAWTVGHTSGATPFRVVNHTFCCVGPNLVIFG